MTNRSAERSPFGIDKTKKEKKERPKYERKTHKKGSLRDVGGGREEGNRPLQSFAQGAKGQKGGGPYSRGRWRDKGEGGVPRLGPGAKVFGGLGPNRKRKDKRDRGGELSDPTLCHMLRSATVGVVR